MAHCQQANAAKQFGEVRCNIFQSVSDVNNCILTDDSGEPTVALVKNITEGLPKMLP